MLRIILVIIISLKFGICLNAQTNIEFYPKMLQNELFGKIGQNAKLIELKIDELSLDQIYLGKYFKVSSISPDSNLKYVYVGRVKTCRAGGCSIKANPQNDTESEYFDYFILYDASIAVQLVKIFNYHATHGHEVSAKNWLKQFKGYKGDTDLIPGKNVDAISGATISVDALTFDIYHKTGILVETLNCKTAKNL